GKEEAGKLAAMLAFVLRGRQMNVKNQIAVLAADGEHILDAGFVQQRLFVERVQFLLLAAGDELPLIRAGGARKKQKHRDGRDPAAVHAFSYTGAGKSCRRSRPLGREASFFSPSSGPPGG